MFRPDFKTRIHNPVSGKQLLQNQCKESVANLANVSRFIANQHKYADRAVSYKTWKEFLAQTDFVQLSATPTLVNTSLKALYNFKSTVESSVLDNIPCLQVSR